MDDAEKLTRTRLFLAACADVRGETPEGYIIPFDRHRLVEALDEEAESGNAFARQYLVLNGLGGRHSPDFSLGLALCQSAGVAFRRYEGAGKIFIRLSPRQIGEMATRAEFREARILAENYLRRVHVV